MSAGIPGAGPSKTHDFAITDRHAVFLDLPVTFRFDLVSQGMPDAWDDGCAARIGIMELDRPGHVRWLGIDPCYVLHVGSAHTDAPGRIVLDGARYSAADTVAMWSRLGGATPATPATPAADAAALGVARLHRWTLDPATGSVTETARDDRPVEFPTLDDRLVGRASRYLHAVSDGADAPSAAEARGIAAIVEYDDATGAADTHPLDAAAGEAVFVPAQDGTAEDDGWLLTITTRRDGSASQLLVLDAADLAGPAVAAVTLPRGVPAGFHRSWIED